MPWRYTSSVSQESRIVASAESSLIRIRADLFRSASQEILTAGFSRVRIWEYGWDLSRRCQRIVLEYKFPSDDPSSPKVGYAVDASQSSLRLLAPTPRDEYSDAVRASKHDLAYLGDSIPEWIADLDLTERQWVEVDITFGAHLFGILAADRDPTQTITEVQFTQFSELARKLATNLTARLYGTRQRHESSTRPRHARIAKDSAQAPPSNRYETESFVTRITPELAEAIDAAFAASFRYSWDTDLLERVDTAIRLPGPNPALPLETYSTIQSEELQRRLTGRAWKDPRCRLVLDFEATNTRLSEQLDPLLEASHTNTLGEVRTVLYAALGKQDRRYLLRFVNRLTAPSLPFLYEQTILDELLSAKENDFIASILRDRLRLLRDATESIREQFSRGDDTPDTTLVDLLQPGLGFDGITSFALLATYDSLDGIQLVGSYGNALTGMARRTDRWFSVQEDPLLGAIIQRPANKRGLTAVALADFRTEKSAFADELRRGNPYPYRQLAFVRVDQTDHTVFGVVPLRSGDRAKTYRDSLGTDVASGALQTYCELASNALARRSAQLLVTGARRALGLITHEVRIPVTLLANTAESAIEQALEVFNKFGIADMDPDFPLDMEAWRRRIEQRREQITVITRLSGLLAQESVDQKLQMHIRPVDLYQLLGEVADDMEYESRVDPNLRATNIDIRACKNLPTTRCDLDLFRVALTNVIRNAVKYSLPPGGGLNPIVNVSGSVDGRRVLIDVANFGFGIPERIRSSIFAPFVRGEIQDERKAIRGMGLGLFLAQRVCQAHDGGVRLVSSRAAFQDRKRLEKNEGFETHFQLWVSSGLQDGPREHKWSRLAPREGSQE